MVTALWDTGNQLYEPYGGQPVHVVTRAVSLALCKTVPQIIYIPFRTVDSEYAVMPGIRIDFMEVEKEGGGIAPGWQSVKDHCRWITAMKCCFMDQGDNRPITAANYACNCE